MAVKARGVLDLLHREARSERASRSISALGGSGGVRGKSWEVRACISRDGFLSLLVHECWQTWENNL